MGGRVSRTDFEWVYTQHPHVARRKLILGECALGGIRSIARIGWGMKHKREECGVVCEHASFRLLGT